MALIRLQKILADAGIASRRGSEELIVEGRVSVDGVAITELGSKFDPENVKVEVDGELSQIRLKLTSRFISLEA
jgi:23S rRNA pseudouridine2605 synthase